MRLLDAGARTIRPRPGEDSILHRSGDKRHFSNDYPSSEYLVERTYKASK